MECMNEKIFKWVQFPNVPEENLVPHEHIW
jgi:hypothetical protein